MLTADALAALRPHAVGALTDAVASAAAAVVTAREPLARVPANKVVDHELARAWLVVAEAVHRDATWRRDAPP